MEQRKHQGMSGGTALLVIDVQNDYCHPEGALARNGNDVTAVPAMLPHLHDLIDAAHCAGVPVIYVQTIHEQETDSEVWKQRSSGAMADVCRADTWGSRFYEVTPSTGDIIVNKHRYSAFICTRLDSILRSQKIDTLVVAGVSTNVCVESTVRDGFMMDYHILVAADSCASFNAEAHTMALKNIALYFGRVLDTDTICRQWGYIKQELLVR